MNKKHVILIVFFLSMLCPINLYSQSESEPNLEIIDKFPGKLYASAEELGNIANDLSNIGNALKNNRERLVTLFVMSCIEQVEVYYFSIYYVTSIGETTYISDEMQIDYYTNYALAIVESLKIDIPIIYNRMTKVSSEIKNNAAHLLVNNALNNIKLNSQLIDEYVETWKKVKKAMNIK